MNDEIQTTIVILAAGEFNKNNPRHYKFLFFKFKRVIEIPILESLKTGFKVSIILTYGNEILYSFLKRKYPLVNIYFAKDKSMISTYQAAFNIDNSEKIIVAGDIIDMKYQDLVTMGEFKGYDVLPRLSKPWKKNNIMSICQNYELRTDLGTGIFKLTHRSQKIFISEENIDKAMLWRSRFNGKNYKGNENTANDIWTWLVFSHFIKLYLNIDSNLKQIEVEVTTQTAKDYDKS